MPIKEKFEAIIAEGKIQVPLKIGRIRYDDKALDEEECNSIFVLSPQMYFVIRGSVLFYTLSK